MQYSNQQPPEGINTSEDHPLKDFAILLPSALLIIVGLVFVLGNMGSWLAGEISFEAETSVAEQYPLAESDNPKIDAYLQQLGDRIAQAEDLPPGMKVHLHYLADDTVNAFATLGGHIFVFRGLLNKIPDENTLAMLLGHEIAHVKYRHPIKSLGRGIVTSIALSTITGSDNGQVLGQAGLLTILHFSREMEQQSDTAAITALQKLYGHTNGASRLFEAIRKNRQQNDQEETAMIFSSHPLDQQRIDHLADVNWQHRWNSKGQTTALPEFIANSL